MSKVKYSGWGLIGLDGKLDPDFYNHYRQGLINFIDDHPELHLINFIDDHPELHWWNYLKKLGYKIVKVKLIKVEK